jgi:hypothetical protein
VKDVKRRPLLDQIGIVVVTSGSEENGGQGGQADGFFVGGSGGEVGEVGTVVYEGGEVGIGGGGGELP